MQTAIIARNPDTGMVDHILTNFCWPAHEAEHERELGRMVRKGYRLAVVPADKAKDMLFEYVEGHAITDLERIAHEARDA